METEFQVGGLAIRNDGLGPTMIVGDVFHESGMWWLRFECDGGRSCWPASLFLPAVT
jgi:hypothetical protein